MIWNVQLKFIIISWILLWLKCTIKINHNFTNFAMIWWNAYNGHNVQHLNSTIIIFVIWNVKSLNRDYATTVYQAVLSCLEQSKNAKLTPKIMKLKKNNKKNKFWIFEYSSSLETYELVLIDMEPILPTCLMSHYHWFNVLIEG